MRYVFDTNVLVSALRSQEGASRRLLLAALDRRLVLLASVPLILEYEMVLTRPAQLRATGLSIVETNALLDVVVSVSVPVAQHYLWRPQLDDPNDEMVLECAVNGCADRLVTFNLRHLGRAASTFGIQAMTPPMAWKEIENRNAQK